MGLEDRLGLISYPAWLREASSRWQGETASRDSLGEGPLVSLAVTAQRGAWNDRRAARTVESLRQQTYPGWEAQVELPASRAAQTGFAAGDSRLRFCQYSTSPQVRLDEIVRGAAGEWLMILEVGDVLSPGLLETAITAVRDEPEADILYWDEDCLSMAGKSFAPWFKPNWSPELLLSANYLKKALFRTALCLDALEIECESDDDFIFRTVESASTVIHIPRVFVHRGTAGKSNHFPFEACNLSSVKASLIRRGISGAAVEQYKSAPVQMRWPTKELGVSIVIPTRDNLPTLRKCLDTLFELTIYPSFEVILLDTGSIQVETRRYYASLVSRPQVHLHDYTGPFNYSRANNLGAGHARGEILLFLNNDVEVIDPDWLEELVRWASRPEIGIVGGKLLHPDGTIQHAGIIIGMEGHASHVFAGQKEGATGPFGSTEWYRDYSAVTGACMAMRRQVFEEIGGFDEGYQLAFSDVEICQRAIQHGYRVMYTPFARLIHHEG
ncbi:MAG TPA: glycosyltransferase family 2 protein, partial [Anaerolineaceae bacterium]